MSCDSVPVWRQCGEKRPDENFFIFVFIFNNDGRCEKCSTEQRRSITLIDDWSELRGRPRLSWCYISSCWCVRGKQLEESSSGGESEVWRLVLSALPQVNILHYTTLIIDYRSGCTSFLLRSINVNIHTRVRKIQTLLNRLASTLLLPPWCAVISVIVYIDIYQWSVVWKYRSICAVRHVVSQFSAETNFDVKLIYTCI